MKEINAPFAESATYVCIYVCMYVQCMCVYASANIVGGAAALPSPPNPPLRFRINMSYWLNHHYRFLHFSLFLAGGFLAFAAFVASEFHILFFPVPLRQVFFSLFCFFSAGLCGFWWFLCLWLLALFAFPAPLRQVPSWLWQPVPLGKCMCSCMQCHVMQ